jgi:hypothetical protein
LARVDTTGSPQSSRTASKNEVLVMDESKPETAAEALARWDAGDVVWTVEMGGLGPGYEQVIHIMAFEIIRELLSHEPLDWTKADAGNALPDYDARQRSEWGRFTNQIEAAVMPKVRGLGSSGAQWGAAQNLAYIVVRKGWRKALDELPAERLIQIDRTWPRLEEPEAVGAVDPHDGVVTE